MSNKSDKRINRFAGKSTRKHNIVGGRKKCKCGKEIYKMEGICAQCYAKTLGVELTPRDDIGFDERIEIRSEYWGK